MNAKTKVMRIKVGYADYLFYLLNKESLSFQEILEIIKRENKSFKYKRLGASLARQYRDRQDNRRIDHEYHSTLN